MLRSLLLWKYSTYNMVLSTKVGTLKISNSNERFPPFFSCAVIGLLENSSLQKVYIANFCHACIVVTPFIVLQWADEFEQEKKDCFSNFFIVSVTVIVLFFYVIVISISYIQVKFSLGLLGLCVFAPVLKNRISTKTVTNLNKIKYA